MITAFGVHTRTQIQLFQKELFAKHLHKDAKRDSLMSPESLTKNFSAFLYEKYDKKLLVLLDTDDGSGGTPFDCKISWPSFNEILQKYKPDDYMVLKQNVNRDPECNQFYPFKHDVYSIGVFSGNPSKIFDAGRKYKEKKLEKDIDVFYAGGLSLQHCRPYAWPKHRDVRKWWAGSGVRGYKKLKEIKEKRKDLNIQIFDGDVPQDSFFEMIHRSKVCMDFPVIGKSSTKFFEYMVFESCVLSLTQQKTPWSCEENVHYFSMGEDHDYECMEEKIDYLLKNPDVRKNIENNVHSIKDELTMESMIKKAESHIENKISSMNCCVLHY